VTAGARRYVRRLAGALAVAVAACSTRPDASSTVDSGGVAASTPAEPATAAVPLGQRDRQAWRAALGWSADCEEGFAVLPDRGTGVELFPLPGGRQLVQVACAPGAYQGSFVYFRVDAAGAPSGPAPLAFPDYADSGEGIRDRLQPEQTVEMYGLPSFLPADARLRVLRRFRGLGDCGLLLTYDVTTPAPTLVELRGKLACDGDAGVAPERWPLLEPRG
jgi:hypothetical protein